MNPRRLPIGVLMIIPIVLGFGLYAFTGQAQEVEDPNATPTPYATPSGPDDGYWATQTAQAPLSPDDQYATYVASQPTPTPPVTARGDFHDGAWVRVNAGAGDCLNARNSPSLSGDYVIVNVCIPDGYEGALTGNAEQADGRWWWHLAGLGWVAEEYIVYVREFDARANVAPELSGVAGKVAFLRGNDVWMMNPDGSRQELLVDHDESTPDRWVPGPAGMTWSPDGTKLAYSIDVYDQQGTTPPRVDLYILRFFEGGEPVLDMYEGLAGGGWSADSVHLGVVRETQAGQMGSGPEGIPAILDVTTGGQLVLGSTRMWQTEAPSFNHDGTLLMVHENIQPSDGTSGTSAIVIYTADGAEHDRVDFSGGATYYGSPEWSPVDNRIAMHVGRQDDGGTYEAQYEVYDVEARAFYGSGKPPKYSDRIGGGCGGGDMWHTTWTRDGSRVLYTFGWGDTGANGVWAWDAATGEQRVLIASNAGSPTSGADGRVMFSASGHIFHGTADGGFPQIITDGHSPAWWVPD